MKAMALAAAMAIGASGVAATDGIGGQLAPAEVRPERRLEVSVEVVGERAKVYEAWTTEEGATSFFAPACKIEMTPGGAYEIYFMPSAPEGSRGAEGTRVLSFVPGELLSFEWCFPPSVPALRAAGAKNWVVVRFDDAGPGRTRVTLTHLGWKDDPDWDKGYEYFSNAWPRVLGNLKKKFEGGE